MFYREKILKVGRLNEQVRVLLQCSVNLRHEVDSKLIMHIRVHTAYSYEQSIALFTRPETGITIIILHTYGYTRTFQEHEVHLLRESMSVA